MKPLVPAALVTRDGGCIILVAECSGNLPAAFVSSLARFHQEHGDDLRGAVIEHFTQGRLIMEGGAVDFNMALGLTLAVQHRFHIILVSKDLSQETTERMGFVHAEDLEQSFRLSRGICPDPEVHIIPSGGSILPLIRPLRPPGTFSEAAPR